MHSLFLLLSCLGAAGTFSNDTDLLATCTPEQTFSHRLLPCPLYWPFSFPSSMTFCFSSISTHVRDIDSQPPREVEKVGQDKGA